MSTRPGYASAQGHFFASSYALVIGLVCSLKTDDEVVARVGEVAKLLDQRVREELTETKQYPLRFSCLRLQGTLTHLDRLLKIGPTSGAPPKAITLLTKIRAMVQESFDKAPDPLRPATPEYEAADWARTTDLPPIDGDNHVALTNYDDLLL